MRVLVTNDDGIHEPGLNALAHRFVELGHDVVVVGPPGQFSGSSASLGTVEHHAVVAVRSVTVTGLEHVSTMTVDGPPALAARAVCSGAFGEIPDVVLSGINPGFNLGRLVMHSGTVGAALTAASLGVCGIALSTSARPARGFDTAALVAGWVTQAVFDAALPPVALNVNVPDVSPEQLTGIGEGNVDEDSISSVAFERADRGLLVRRTTNEPPFRVGTDSELVSRGWVSVSKISPPWCSSDVYPDIVDHVLAKARNAMGGWSVT